jgi:putative ABC transport system permease protein
MRRLISFAIKNLARYKRRTILTASAVAVGIAIFIFIDGWLLGAELESDRNIVWYETSSAKVMHPDYWEERDRLPLSIVIENPREAVETLEREGIPSAPRTVFFADLVVWQDPFEEDGSMPVRVFALDPQKDDDVFRFRDTVKEGRYLEPGEEGIMIGAWLAEDLGAEVGFPVALVTRTREGYFQTIDAEVVAILDVPNPYVNRSSVFMDLSSADYYLQMDGAVTEINLSFPGLDNADEQAGAVASMLDASGFDLDVKSWRTIASAYGALTEAKQAGTGMILLLLFIIATVGISNTMLMAVYERTSEIGMLRAIGMKDRDIRFAFMIEAAGIGVLGSMIGILLGILSNIYMVNVGIDFTWMIRDMDIGYRSAGVMYGAWNPGTMVQAFFTGIFICFVVALIPTRRAMKMKITDCLRHT